jgi:hypothetical protein
VVGLASVDTDRDPFSCLPEATGCCCSCHCRIVCRSMRRSLRQKWTLCCEHDSLLSEQGLCQLPVVCKVSGCRESES